MKNRTADARISGQILIVRPLFKKGEKKFSMGLTDLAHGYPPHHY